jgi:hypothetical protein
MPQLRNLSLPNRKGLVRALTSHTLSSPVFQLENRL